MARLIFRTAPVRVRVPATSANLGPGFDALGLALELHDELTVGIVADGLSVSVTGEGAGRVPTSERHLVVRALRAGFAALGGQPPGLELGCVNRIPHGRGLGSSSAAIIGGLVAARALVSGGSRLLDDVALLRLATELEGHPDNVAACLAGGLTIAWVEESGARATRLEPADGLRPVVFVPATKASTAAVRKLLPASVPHADAARTVGRAALLVHALSADPGLLFAATEDWLHQPYRAAAMPKSAELVETLRANGVPAVISGAGPTVLAFANGLDAPGTTDLLARCPSGWTPLHLAIDPHGVRFD